MSNGYQELVTCLENRYDYHSARVVAADALLSVGIAEADSYKPAELQKIVDSLGAGGRNMDSVWLAVGVAPTGTSMPAAPAPAPAPAEASAETEAAEAAPVADDDAGKKEAPAKKAPAKKGAAKKGAAKKK
jgi:hypothetical protein